MIEIHLYEYYAIFNKNAHDEIDTFTKALEELGHFPINEEMPDSDCCTIKALTPSKKEYDEIRAFFNARRV